MIKKIFSAKPVRCLTIVSFLFLPACGDLLKKQDKNTTDSNAKKPEALVADSAGKKQDSAAVDTADKKPSQAEILAFASTTFLPVGPGKCGQGRLVFMSVLTDNVTREFRIGPSVAPHDVVINIEPSAKVSTYSDAACIVKSPNLIFKQGSLRLDVFYKIEDVGPGTITFKPAEYYIADPTDASFELWPIVIQDLCS